LARTRPDAEGSYPGVEGSLRATTSEKHDASPLAADDVASARAALAAPPNAPVRAGPRGRAAHALLVFALAFGAADSAHADHVVAVLSSDLGSYQEALEGFKESFNRAVPVWSLSAGVPEIEPGTRVVVAFGGTAALVQYPAHVALVYCMAPGTKVGSLKRGAPTVEISMLPRPEVVLANLVQLQTGLRRLAIFWVSPGVEPYIEMMARAAAPYGIELWRDKLGSATDLPERLRRLSRSADALWLPPDPLLVNARAFAVLKDFSWSNDVPFYVPTSGLVEKGAVASVSCGFRDIGRAAARAAQQALDGTVDRTEMYPEKCDITVNLTAAANAGLRTPVETLGRSDKVLP